MPVPEFIDANRCLCALVPPPPLQPGGSGQWASKDQLLWRCVLNEPVDISSGKSGKWYNTTIVNLVSGEGGVILNTPENGPDLDHPYFWETDHFANASPATPTLLDADRKCTGKNDTALSNTFLENTSSASATLPAATSSTGSTATASSSSSIAPIGTTASSAPPATTPSATKQASFAPVHNPMKAMLLLSMLLAPLAMAWI